MSEVLPAIKPLRRPRLWAGLWAAAVLLVIVVCLIPPPPIPLPENSDKGEHFLAYFILAGITYVISLFFWPTPAVPLTVKLSISPAFSAYRARVSPPSSTAIWA